MVSVLSSTKTPRILIGRSGSNGPFGEIADGLRTRGYRVTEWESSRIGAHSTEQDVRDQVKDIDLAFLVIRDKDARDNGGPIRPLHRILVEAGLMQGKMEVDRVVLLVEDGVDGLSPDTGLSFIRFSADQPDAVMQDLVNRIEMLFPEDLGLDGPPPPGASDRIYGPKVVDAASATGRPEEFWLAVRLAALALFAGLLVLLLAAFFLLQPSDDDVDDGEVAIDRPDTAQIEPGMAGRALGTSTTELAGEGAAIDEDGVVVEDQPEAVIGDDAAASEATRGAANQLLPATCMLNLRKGSLIDGAISCDGAGQVNVEGYVGPWHNDVAAIAAGEGVGATVEYELRDDGSTDGPSVVDVGVGTTLLNQNDARFGISTVIVRFSGPGQHLHFFQSDDAGGESVTLTFSLDR